MFRYLPRSSTTTNLAFAVVFGLLGALLGVFVTGGFTSPIIFAFGMVMAWIGTCFFTVPQKSVVVIQRLGKFNKICHSGINAKLPMLIDELAGGLSLQYHSLSSEITAKTKDNIFMSAPIQLQVVVKAGSEEKAYYELDNPRRQIEEYCVNVIRSEISEMELEEVYKNKEKVEAAVKTELSQTIGDYGYELKNIILQDPVLPKEIQDSYNRVMASKRDLEAARNDAEAIKAKQLGHAQAEAESLKLRAEAYADYRRTIAKGNSEAMEEFIGGETDLTQKDVMNFFAIMDKRDTLRDVSQNPATLIITDNEGSLKDSDQTAQMVNLITALKGYEKVVENTPPKRSKPSSAVPQTK